MFFFTGQLPKGVKYVGQDNYIKYILDDNKYTYLYSDSATSCIIVAVTGQDITTKKDVVYFSHLSRPERFETFFEIVKVGLQGNISLLAQGANPPDIQGSANNNILTLLRIINPLISGDNPFIKKVSLSLGQGNPNTEWGTFGINVDNKSAEKLKTSNQFFLMNDLQRDSTNGLQTLFCIYGLKINEKANRIVLHNVEDNFTSKEINDLLKTAHENNFEKICTMTDEEILKNYSSTPEFEPAWFPTTMRNAGYYVKQNYKEGL